MDIQKIIATRRDGGRHTREQLFELAQAAALGTVPDYQLSAWLMAAYLNPLNDSETAWLTAAMAATGETIDLSGLRKPWLDKHSTGGVGDKTTIALLPILAACGLTVIKMSGRGLGMAGGTLDKLASVPGLRLDLGPDDMTRQAREIGLALTGQSPNLAPADKALYALRDATGTVENIPLIASSVLSKKVAGGAETIVLDVKAGSGAYMKTPARARELAECMLRVGAVLGLNLRVVITDMSQPLGGAVGNALEVREAIRVLAGRDLSPAEARFRDLLIELGGISLEATGLVDRQSEGCRRVLEAIETGAALAKMQAWFSAQGATMDLSHEDALSTAPVQETMAADRDGWIETLHAETFGWTVVELGGGRQHKEDVIDPSVGVTIYQPVGGAVRVGDPIVTIHASSKTKAEAARNQLEPAIRISAVPVPAVPLVG